MDLNMFDSLAAPGSVRFRLGSYNLRMGNLDTDPDNIWSVRKPRLIRSLLESDFDIAGIQEANALMQKELVEELGGTYSFWFFSPYSQDGVGNKAHGIMFRTSLFTISDKRFFWASDTPDIISLNDTGDLGNFRRGGCCAVLTHKDSGMRLFLMCAHACLNPGANARYAPVYCRMEERFNPEGLPSFFVGDLNTAPDSEASGIFRKHWADAFLSVDASARRGLLNTYNDYRFPSGSERIDYIYYRGKGVDVKSYGCDGSLYEGLYASDHFPVMAEISITR